MCLRARACVRECVRTSWEKGERRTTRLADVGRAHGQSTVGICGRGGWKWREGAEEEKEDSGKEAEEQGWVDESGGLTALISSKLSMPCHRRRRSGPTHICARGREPPALTWRNGWVVCA